MYVLKKIHVPRGKELRSLAGNYRYVGPRFVIVHRGSRFPETFTDGTKWYYQGEEPKEEIAVEPEALKEPKKDAPKKKRKPKVKIEEKLDGPTNESVQTEGKSSRFKHKEGDDRDSKRNEAV